MLRESIADSPLTPWLRERFDAIALNTRGDREVVFSTDLTATEKELTQVLDVRQTPAIIFLDGTNRAVVRSDGYRTPTDFERLVRYVDSKSYLSMDLATFVARTASGPHYAMRAHPSFEPLTDLAAVERPLMVIFEDAWCDGCELMHDTLLRDATVNELLGALAVVRFDARADTAIVTPDGTRTTPREWAESLALAARPAIVLMDGPVELVRINGVLRRFHFQTALRYVAEGHYHAWPSLREFGRAWRDKLLAEGHDVDVGAQ